MTYAPILVSNKRPYSAPTIVEYGSVATLTQALPARGMVVPGGLLTVAAAGSLSAVAL